jgi:hypothetical protein
VLDECLAAAVEAAAHDLVVDLIALARPTLEVGGAGPIGRHADRAVEGDPGHEPTVGEVLLAAARFPNALVGPVPVGAQPIDHGSNLLPALMPDV